MRQIVFLLVLCALVGCGPSERDQKINEAPLSHQHRDPKPKIPTDDELKEMSLEEVQAILDNDRSPETWRLLNLKVEQLADQQIEGASLEAIQQRIEADPNDRVAWRLLVMRVAQLAGDVVESDHSKAYEYILKARELLLKHQENMSEDLKMKVFQHSNEAWGTIEKRSLVLFQKQYASDAEQPQQEEAEETSPSE